MNGEGERGEPKMRNEIRADGGVRLIQDGKEPAQGPPGRAMSGRDPAMGRGL